MTNKQALDFSTGKVYYDTVSIKKALMFWESIDETNEADRDRQDI